MLVMIAWKLIVRVKAIGLLGVKGVECDSELDGIGDLWF